jgi:hypothetical protein
MRGVEGKAGTRRFGFSYILLVVAIVVYLGVSAYSALATEWKAKAEVPQIDPILQLIKGLRQYQQVTASFPQTFDQVEAQVWKHPKPPSYGSGGHTLVLRNYYYLYTRISPTRCTLWAIPLGAKASEASSYFLILTPTEREKFKGPALDFKEASTVSGIPTYAQLAMLGMIKQEDPLPQKKR